VKTIPTLLAATAFCLASTAKSEARLRPGDRIAIIGNTFADQLRIHGYLESLLLSRSTEHPVSIRNLGWAGDMLGARDRPTHFPSEESTLLAHQTDVIIACFGMGESFEGESGLDRFKTDLEAFVTLHRDKKYNGHSAVRLILVSPIAYENHGKTTPNWERRNRELAAYSRAVNEVSLAAGLPYIDVNQITSELMEDASAPPLTGNGIHLNNYGYWALSRTLADALLPGPSPWRVTVDAANAIAFADGVAVSDLKTEGRGLRFTVTELTWPSLGAPLAGNLHRGVEGNQDRLKVTHLGAGDYQLTIDEQPIAIASATQWAEGIPILNSPTHQALETFRQAVHDKNLHFVYSWKALNQVHIVGERRRSPSGRALPGELMEFNRMAQQKDAALGRGIKLGTREWRLAPIP
tara:strand:- start:1014 stop:2237 length:1224 start_codon:yes stop_codon:yes gene_type:complete